MTRCVCQRAIGNGAIRFTEKQKNSYSYGGKFFPFRRAILQTTNNSPAPTPDKDEFKNIKSMALSSSSNLGCTETLSEADALCRVSNKLEWSKPP